MGDSGADNNAGGAVERVTIAEAADLLGVHPNTVRNRVKAGLYRAEKVLTEKGPTWMIERDSLTANTPTSASQQLVGGVPIVQQEVLQELAKAIVREAGIVRDPEREALLENDRGRVEFFKTVLLLDAALLAGAAAVGAVMPDPRSFGLLLWAFATIFVSLATGFIGLFSATQIMGVSGNPMSYIPRLPARTLRDLLQVLTAVAVGAGIITFVQFVFLNLPKN